MDVRFYDIKEVIEILLGRLGIRDIEFSREENNPTFILIELQNLL